MGGLSDRALNDDQRMDFKLIDQDYTTENDIKLFANSLQIVWRHAKSSKEFAKSFNRSFKELANIFF